MPNRYRVMITKVIIMFCGFFLLAYGGLMGIEASLGVAPWHVLHLGITNYLPVTVGRASQIVGLAVLLCAVLLGVRPNFGTWLNMFMVGYFMDLIVAFRLVPKVSGLPYQALYLGLGLIVQSMGVSSYICAGLGTGPRDSLMLGVTRKTGWRVGLIRSSLECAVVTIGYFLGGPVGIGTVLSALATGPVLERCMLALSRLRSIPFFADVIRLPASVRIGGMAPTPDVSGVATSGR